jgi:hypothetical protein
MFWILTLKTIQPYGINMAIWPGPYLVVEWAPFSILLKYV